MTPPAKRSARKTSAARPASAPAPPRPPADSPAAENWRTGADLDLVAPSGVAPTDGPAEAPTPFGDPAWQAEVLCQRRIEAARIPRRFVGKTLDNFSARDKVRRQLVDDARRYITSFHMARPTQDTPPAPIPYPKGILMTGSVGCGKSHLAVAILREVIGKGYSGLYYNSPDLMRDLRATIARSSEITEDDLLEDVTSTDLLVFDDVGAEKMSEYVIDRFYLIINERYEGCKPVIITTNLDEEALESRLGKRIVSRLREMCAPFGPFPDDDWRRRQMR